jgi:NTE family protein
VRTALVLGAGGFTGQAFHVGALCALQELTGFDGRNVDILVGTSAGSLVAAGLAGRLSAADLAAELTGDPLSREGTEIRTRAHAQGDAARVLADPLASRRGPLDPWVLLSTVRHPFRARPAAVVSSLLPAGRQSTEPIARGVRYLHGDSWPDVDLRICAVRTRDARRVVFGTPGAPFTDVGTAVAASCAIPAYFAPVRIDGLSYVDGGVHSPSNADVVVQDAPDLVVVLSPMSVGPRAGARTDLAVRLAVRRYLAIEVRRLRRTGAEVVVIQPSPTDLDVMGLNPMRGSRIGDVVTTVAASVRARLEMQPRLAGVLAQR